MKNDWQSMFWMILFPLALWIYWIIRVRRAADRFERHLPNLLSAILSERRLTLLKFEGDGLQRLSASQRKWGEDSHARSYRVVAQDHQGQIFHARATFVESEVRGYDQEPRLIQFDWNE
jgi:hypothetical protein